MVRLCASFCRVYREIRGFIWLMSFAAVLSACGGGGGSGDSNTPLGSAVTLSPASTTIDPGQTLSMRIAGGTGPYSVVSSDPQALSVPGTINNLNAADFTATAGDVRATEDVTVTVSDHNGKTATAVVTVRYVSMSVTPPSLTLAASKAQLFTIYGGRAPFTVNTTRPDLLFLDTASLTQNKTFGVLAGNVSTQIDDVGVLVTDASGNTVSSKVSVIPSIMFSSLQISPTGASGGASGAIGAGQQGVIRVQVGDSYSVPRSLAFEKVAGDFTLTGADAAGRLVLNIGADRVGTATLSVTPGAITQSAKVRVTDIATGTFVNGVFQIAGLALSASPASVSVVSDTTLCKSGDVGSIQIFGGVPPYAIVSSAPSIVTVNPGVVAQSGGNVALTGYGVCTSGTNSAVLTVTDNTGAKLDVAFKSTAVPAATLSLTPATVTATVGNTVNLTIGGGVPPFKVTSSNTAIATVDSVVVNQVAVSAKGAGNVSIVVSDALGNTATTALTVAASPPGPALAVVPATMTAAAGSLLTLTVSGGVVPYKASSSNGTVAAVTAVTGNLVSVTAYNSGTANAVTNIVVTDSAGATVSAALTVTPPAPGPALAVVPATISAGINQSLTLTISGGVQPYQATASNVNVANIAYISGAWVGVNTYTAGTSSIVIRDSAGATATAVVTVNAPPAPSQLAVSPTTVTMNLYNSGVLTISGGTPPYSASPSNSNMIAISSIAGNKVYYQAMARGTASIVVSDSTNAAASASITIN